MQRLKSRGGKNPKLAEFMGGYYLQVSNISKKYFGDKNFNKLNNHILVNNQNMVIFV